MNGINNLLGAEIEVNLRKRASQCMGTFAVALNGQQLQQLTVFLLNRIDKSTTKTDQLTQVQCISLMAKTCGSKLEPFVDHIVTLLGRLISD